MKKSINVLHLTTHLNLGGISSYIAILGKGLIKNGHSVSVLSSGGQTAGDLKAKGIRCFEFPIRTKSEVNPKLFLALPGIVSLLKQERFDILHAHTRVTEVLASWAGRSAGLPYISTAHGFYKHGLGRRLFPCWGERVVAVSPLVAEELEKTHRVGKEKITVVQNALDIEDLEKRLKDADNRKNRAVYGIPEDAFAVGCISRLVRDKGQEYLVEAVKQLVPKIPNIFLLLVGDGRERLSLESQVKELGLQKHVRLIAGVGDTASVLSAMDVYAHPATFREGFGLSMAEAMIAKKPVVATTIPAINTLFQNDVNAFLVPPKDAAALADVIGRLAQERSTAARIAEGGYALASKLCRSERQSEEMEQVYNHVIETWKKKKN